MQEFDTLSSPLAGIDFSSVRFGEIFAGHMLVADYKEGEWTTGRILPYGKIQLEPSIAALHYGQIVFEGLKAFYTVDGKVQVFRPKAHLERMNRSNERLCMPEVPESVFVDGLRELIARDRSWVPTERGTALYIRPFIFATDPFLGVRVSETYKFIIVNSPVGAYFREGFKPVKLITSEKYARAVKGGLGSTKTPANYAASLKPAREAREQGFAQVVWLDGREHKYIDEVGTMNIFFVRDGKLHTPPLSDTILAGITRNTAITLAKEWGMEVVEAPIDIDVILEEARSGKVTEAFGTGTAAVIAPIGGIQHKGQLTTFGKGDPGPVSQKLYNTITGIQYGETADAHGWCMEV